MRKLSLFILLVVMPLYIFGIVSVAQVIVFPNRFLELLYYVLTGILWIFPFKRVFRGVGKAAKSPNHTRNHKNPNAKP